MFMGVVNLLAADLLLTTCSWLCGQGKKLIIVISQCHKYINFLSHKSSVLFTEYSARD